MSYLQRLRAVSRGILRGYQGTLPSKEGTPWYRYSLLRREYPYRLHLSPFGFISLRRYPRVLGDTAPAKGLENPGYPGTIESGRGTGEESRDPRPDPQVMLINQCPIYVQISDESTIGNYAPSPARRERGEPVPRDGNL